MQTRGIEEIELDLLLEAVYQRYHHDFRSYARASLKRRLREARKHFGCANFSELQARLLYSPAVLAQLLPWMTVQVSEMFRDPGYYRALRDEVIPHLRTFPSIRVWVAGCGTGEELYSLAILFAEEGLAHRTLIHATEVSAMALATAKAGTYALDRVPRFAENHAASGAKGSLAEHYVSRDGAAVFAPSLKERIVFSEHSLGTDGVFAEVHLVSCRNVLIYYNPELKRRALGLFHASLIRRGYLTLGAGEGVDASEHPGVFWELPSGRRIYKNS